MSDNREVTHRIGLSVWIAIFVILYWIKWVYQ